MTCEQEILSRVTQLERANRRFKQCFVVMAVLLGLVVSSGQVAPEKEEGPQSLEVADLKLVDARGIVRARLESGEAGPALSFFDANEKSRVTLLLEGDNGGLLLRDGNNVIRSELSLRENVPSVRFHRASGKVGLQAFLSETNGAGVELNRAGDTAGMRLVVADTGSALVIGDRTGQPRVIAGVGSKDETKLVLASKTGETLFQKP